MTLSSKTLLANISGTVDMMISPFLVGLQTKKETTASR
jgi:hypothetical protein